MGTELCLAHDMGGGGGGGGCGPGGGGGGGLSGVKGIAARIRRPIPLLLFLLLNMAAPSPSCVPPFRAGRSCPPPAAAKRYLRLDCVAALGWLRAS